MTKLRDTLLLCDVFFSSIKVFVWHLWALRVLCILRLITIVYHRIIILIHMRNLCWAFFPYHGKCLVTRFILMIGHAYFLISILFILRRNTIIIIIIIIIRIIDNLFFLLIVIYVVIEMHRILYILFKNLVRFRILYILTRLLSFTRIILRSLNVSRITLKFGGEMY